MNDERIFRVVAAVLAAAGAAVGVSFRRAAARSGEKLGDQRRQEGAPLLLLRAVSGLLMFGTLLAYLVAPQYVARSRLPLPAWLRWFGAGLSVAAMPLLRWVMGSLGRNLTDTVAIRREHTLVTAGPYRWVRHPFYAVTSLSFAGFVLLTANWVAGLALILFWTYLWRRTPLEEAKLVERFGDEYRAYAARTGRFIPRV